jgi:hypothetical protein
MHTAVSINEIEINIPAARWKMIAEAHPEVARYLNDTLEAIEDPDVVYAGIAQRLLAVKEIERGKFLIVIYREKNKEGGQLITVFLTRNLLQFDEFNILWKKNT